MCTYRTLEDRILRVNSGGGGGGERSAGPGSVAFPAPVIMFLGAFQGRRRWGSVRNRVEGEEDWGWEGVAASAIES